MQVPGEEQPRKRACVRGREGREFENPILIKDGVRVAPVLHLSTDMGPIGLPAQQFMANRMGLRITSSFDLLHRLQANLHDAQQGAGLLLTRFQFQVVTRMRRGPFQPGGGNHGLLHSSAEEFFQLSTAENPIFQAMFDELTEAAGMQGPHAGTEEHQQALWHWCRSQLLSKGEGREARLRPRPEGIRPYSKPYIRISAQRTGDLRASQRAYC